MCLRDFSLIKINYICNYWLKITNIKMADNQENNKINICYQLIEKYI